MRDSLHTIQVFSSKMGKIFVAVCLLIFVTVLPLGAKPTVTCTIKTITQHNLLVMFSWEVLIHSDKNWDVCDLAITFHDSQGQEVYAVHDRLKVKIGANTFKGDDICETKLWKRIRRYVAKLDCVF